MANERKRKSEDVARTPDSRVQYDELRRKEHQDENVDSPAPYDIARPGTPDDRVIEKGEHEQPGPTSDELEPEDNVGQSNQIDRQGQPGERATGARSRMGHDGEGDLGGDGLHRRINNADADFTDDDETADEDLMADE